MTSIEVLPQRSSLYIPANKQSAWVYKKGTDVVKDKSKEHQGVWAFPDFTLLGSPSPVEVWVFRDTDKLEVPKEVLLNNPDQGTWGYATSVKDARDAQPEDMIFYPPDSKWPKSFRSRGVWVKPTYKRDMSALEPHSTGFLKISREIKKDDKHSVAGTWKMLGHNDDVIRGKKKQQKRVDDDKGKWIIYIRTHKGEVFTIPTIPGSRILQCKDKISKKRGIPQGDQRLSFEEEQLKDDKTLVGSGVRNGDTIDLGPMEIFVRTRKGKKFLFEVDHEELIEYIKAMAEPKVHIPIEDQRMHFKRLPVDNGNTLAKYKVRHRNVLDLDPMIIFVKPLEGNTIELEVEPLDAIRSVKTKVQNRIRMVPEDQHLYFEGKELTKPETTLSDNKIRHLNTLVMRDKRPKAPKRAASAPQKAVSARVPEDMIIYIVKDWDNKKFSLSVEPGNTILDVKERIKNKKKIPVDSQILTFKQEPTHEEKSLQDSRIRNKSILHLEMRPLTIEVPNGDKIPLDVDPNEPIDTLKERIEDATGIPKDVQFLWSRGKPLDDKKTIDDCGIPDDEPIQVKRAAPPKVTLNPPGGPPFEVPIDPDDTINEIKKKVGKKLGMPPRKFELVLEGEGDEPMDNARKAVPGESYIPKFVGPPEITIKDPNGGRPFVLHIDQDDTIDAVKRKVGKKLNRPPRKFELVPDGKHNEPVDGDKKAVPGETYFPKFADPSEITVKTPNGRNFTLVIDPDDTIEDVKKKAVKPTGFPLGHLRLVDDDGEEPDDASKPNPGQSYNLEPPVVAIELPDKTRVELNLLPKQNMGDIKDILEERCGIPKAKQRVFFLDGDDELKDDMPVFKTGIKDGSKLEMRIPPEISVKTPDGRTFILVIDPDEDTNDIKRKIAKQIGIPVRGLDLKFDDDEPFNKDSRLSHGDILTVEPPKINIMLPDGGKVRLDLLPIRAIEDVKDMIEKETGTPKAQQRIFFLDDDGNELDDKTPISKTEIKPGTVLQMRLPDKLEIPVKSSDGRTFVLVVDPDDTVDDAKRKISNFIGVPPQDLRISIDHDDDIEEAFDHLSKGDVLIVDPKTIDIELPNRDRIQLSILPTHTIEDIKDMIEEKTGTPPSKQRIFFLDKDSDELDDRTPVTKIGLPLGSALQMRLPEKLEIPIKTPDGRIFTLIVDPGVKVSDFKRELARLGIPIKQLRLMDLDGEEMEDDEPLSDYKIRNGEILELEPPQIEIELPNRSRIQLTVLPIQTIGDIKNIIEEKTGTPKANQRVFFLDAEGKELEDDVPFSKTELKHGTALVMRDVPEDQEITFKTRDGRIFVLTILPEDTVKDVKKKLREKVGLLVGGFLLGDVAFDDLEDDDIFLDQNGVRHGAVLVVDPPEVEIEVPGAGKVKMVILPTTTIGDVKKVIEEQIPEYKAKKQRMFFFDNNDELDDETLFAKIEFENGVQLELRSFEIFVEHWNGQSVIIDVETTEYMDDVRNKINEAMSIPQNQQRLMFQERPVREDRNLKEHHLEHHSKLLLLPMTIIIHDPNGKKLSFTVELEDSILSLKERISEKTGTKIEIQCLMSGSQELQNRRTLSECNIEHQDVIVLELFMVTVMDWTGDTFPVNGLRPTDSMDSLKGKIMTEKQVPKKKQRLFLNGVLLGAMGNLEDEEVKHRSIVVLEDPDGNEITLPDSALLSLKILKTKKFKDDNREIWPVVPDWKKRIFFFDNDDQFDGFVDLTVMHWTGKTFILKKILLRETVNELKAKIFKLEQIQVKKQKISFGGKLLVPTKTLRQQLVRHKSVLVMEGKREGNIHLPDADRVSLGVLPTLLLSSVKVKIKHWNGETFHVEAEATDYMDDLRDSIFELKSIPVDHQRLTLNGESVNDVDNLKSQNILDGTTLVLEPMKISVHSPAGKTLTFDVELDDTIRRIKKLLLKMTGIAVRDQCIMFGGEELIDKKTLAECEVDHEDLLTLEVFAISIMHWSGETFSLARVHPTNTIDDIKDEILSMKYIAKKKQKLSFHGKELKKSKTLKDEAIVHRAVLILEEASTEVISNEPKRKISFMEGFMGASARPSLLLLTIKLWNGDIFRIQVDPAEYADDVKEKIFERRKIPVDQQRLVFQGQSIRDDATLQDQEITTGSTLELISMKISVEVPGGERLLFEVELEDTIRRVKTMIASEGNYKEEDQCIVVGGDELDDGVTLGECEINHEDVLTMEIFKIKVMHWSGELFDVDNVHPYDIIDTLKGAIMDAKHVPKRQQRLTFYGNLVSDKKTLSDEGIRHKSVLLLERPAVDLDIPTAHDVSFDASENPSLTDANLIRTKTEQAQVSTAKKAPQGTKKTSRRHQGETSANKWWEKSDGEENKNVDSAATKKPMKIVFKKKMAMKKNDERAMKDTSGLTQKKVPKKTKDGKTSKKGKPSKKK